MNDGTTVRRATAGCASKRCRSQGSRRVAVRPLIDPRWRNPHIYRSASAKAARSSHPVPMSGTLADVGYGGEAPLMDGGRGEGLHDRQSPTTARVTEPLHPGGSLGEKSSYNPRITACEDFKEESGGAPNAGESSTLPDSDASRRPSARRSALSNTFCQAGGASKDDGAKELSRGNDAAKAAGGEKEDALDGGRKRVRDGRGNPTPEGSVDGAPPTSNKSVRREGEGAADEPPLPRSYTLDTGIPSHDDDGDESDEGLPMPPDLLDPPDNDAQQFTGALTGLRKFSDASNSGEAGEGRRMPDHACHPQAPLQSEGGGAGSPSKAFACGSMVKRPHLPVPELGSCACSGRAWRLWTAQCAQGERLGHWAPSHCLGCSRSPPPESPVLLCTT